MRVTIDKDRCAGHARCNAVPPQLFHLDDDGYIAVDGFEVPAGSEADAELGADSCPEQVITVVR